MASPITTTVTWADNDQVTSAKLNEIVSGMTFNANAITGTTLALTGNKLKVGTITASELGTGSVTDPALGVGAVTETKILDAAVTASKLGTASVTAEKIVDGVITFAKLITSAVGTAAELVAQTASKLVTADKVKYSPCAAKAWGEFTTDSTSRTITVSHNIASVVRSSSQSTSVAFSAAMSTANYVVVCQQSEGDAITLSDVGTTNIMAYSRTVNGFVITHPSEAAKNSISFVVYGTLA